MRGGTDFRPRAPFEVTIFSSSTAMPGMCRGAEPVAIYAVRPDSLYGSIVHDPHITFRNQMRFQRWLVRTGLRSGRHGIVVALETLARRTKARARHSAAWRAVRRRTQRDR